MGIKRDIDRIDFAKWAAVVLFIVLGIAANSFFAEVPLPLRAIGWLVLLCIALIIALRTKIGRRFWKFAQESRGEMRKVVWPSRHETFQTTLIVVGVVILFAFILWCADSFLMWAISWFTV